MKRTTQIFTLPTLLLPVAGMAAGVTVGGAGSGGRTGEGRSGLEAAARRPLSATCPPVTLEPGPPGNKPVNILCVVTEDTSTPYFGCYGGKLEVTPTVTKLAREGVRYTNFYDVIGVSAPSRVALITGVYPTAIGANNMRSFAPADNFPADVTPYYVVPPAGVKCYPEYLRARGYYCTNNNKTDYQFPAPLTAWDDCSNKAHWMNAPAGMPFLAIFNIEVTHESYVWVNRNLPLTVDPKTVPVPPYYPATDTVRRDIARVYSNLRLADQFLADRLKELDDAGVADNTIVIFYADNGGPLLRQKRTVYEMGLHVPLIIRYPKGYKAGTTDDRMCSFVDIPATIMSLAGMRPPLYMHGRAFAGRYESAKPREYIYAAQDRCDIYYDKVGAVRDKRFIYLRNYMPEIAGYLDAGYRRQMPLMMDILRERDAGRLNAVQMNYFKAPRPAEEFYDAVADPDNIHNLIDDKRYAVDIDRLRKAHNQWVHDFNDMWFMPEKELSEYMMPGGVQRVVQAPVVTDGGDGASIFCATEGSSIAYQINGAGFTPKHWLLYTKPVALKRGDVLTAVGVRAGYKNSPAITFQKDE